MAKKTYVPPTWDHIQEAEELADKLEWDLPDHYCERKLVCTGFIRKCKDEIRRRNGGTLPRKKITGPPSPKMIRTAEGLAVRTGLELPNNYAQSHGACGGFIAKAQRKLFAKRA